MAVIAQSAGNGGLGAVPLTRTVLSASDTLAYSSGSSQVLVLFNTTASPVIVTLLGNAASTITPVGYGGTLSVAAGTAQTVPASGTLYVPLDKYQAFLVGTSVAVTGGVGVTAHLVTVA